MWHAKYTKQDLKDSFGGKLKRKASYKKQIKEKGEIAELNLGFESDRRKLYYCRRARVKVERDVNVVMHLLIHLP